MINQEKKYINIDPELIIGTAEAARMLGVSDRAVRGLIVRGTLPAAKYCGKYFLHKKAVAFFQEFRAHHSVDLPDKPRNPQHNNSYVPATEPKEFSEWPPIYPDNFVDFWRQSNNNRYGIRYKRHNVFI